MENQLMNCTLWLASIWKYPSFTKVYSLFLFAMSGAADGIRFNLVWSCWAEGYVSKDRCQFWMTSCSSMVQVQTCLWLAGDTSDIFVVSPSTLATLCL